MKVRPAGLVRALATLALVLAAEPVRGEEVPLPPPREAPPPEAPARPPELPSKAEPAANSEPASPSQPSPRPEPSGDAGAAPTAEPPAPPAAPPAAPKPAIDVEITSDQACRERLADLGVAFRPLPMISEESCVVTAPLEVSAIAEGVAVEPPATMRCEAAEALARWTAEVVAPAGQDLLGSAVTRLSIAGSYVCRARNNADSAPPSEHGTGSAADIAAFRFGAARSVGITGKPDGDDGEARFIARVRRGACSYFTTVLGPGADAAHGDHLHLDIKERSNGFRICQ